MTVWESQKPSGWDTRASSTSWSLSVWALPLQIVFRNVGRSFLLVLWPSLLHNWWARKWNTAVFISTNLNFTKVSCLENIHSRHYIHHDIKPTNTLTSTKDSPSMVYLADFGITKQFCHPNMHIHIPSHDGTSFTGTPVFASINSHQGDELSWRDDIESLAYLLINFLWGSLPWLGIHSVDTVLRLKREISTEDLCSGLPIGFRLILEHTRALAFIQKPDYKLLQSYIQDVCAMVPNDTSFDWQCSRPSSPATLAPVTPNRHVQCQQQSMPVTPVGFVETRVYIFHFYVLVQSNIDNVYAI